MRIYLKRLSSKLTIEEIGNRINLYLMIFRSNQVNSLFHFSQPNQTQPPLINSQSNPTTHRSSSRKRVETAGHDYIKAHNVLNAKKHKNINSDQQSFSRSMPSIPPNHVQQFCSLSWSSLKNFFSSPSVKSCLSLKSVHSVLGWMWSAIANHHYLHKFECRKLKLAARGIRENGTSWRKKEKKFFIFAVECDADELLIVLPSL